MSPRDAVTSPGPAGTRVLRRFLLLAAAMAFALVAAWVVVRPYFFGLPPGDYEVREGDILLTDGDWDRAIDRFDAALAVSPDHRGALMGKAIALMQSDRPEEARPVLDRLIETSGGADIPADPTGRGVLASAYANRGILSDREGNWQAALADYRRALQIDAGAVSGPGLVDRILYGRSRAATVADRAAYLEKQLALPESERVLRVPEIDARQRMWKP